MKTTVIHEQDAILVKLTGYLDFETFLPLQENLDRLLEQPSVTEGRPIVFDFSGLEFVGSSGISSFLKTLKTFNESAPTKPIYKNVKSEFRRMIEVIDDDSAFQILESPIKPSTKRTRIYQ